VQLIFFIQIALLEICPEILGKSSRIPDFLQNFKLPTPELSSLYVEPWIPNSLGFF
jgi:hypothetical protein